MPAITQTLTIHRKPANGLDRYGNPVDVPFVEWEQVPWDVYAVSPQTREEDFGADGRESVNSWIRVYAPIDGACPEPDDRVTVPSLGDAGAFEVLGEVARWEKNPHVAITRHKGIIVRLGRFRR